jgi:hypothetical protein
LPTSLSTNANTSIVACSGAVKHQQVGAQEKESTAA